ncbi:MAG: hypothetical protein OXF41_07550 [bacterium]|nr:hypothetical protein [bacterium]
MVNGPADGLVSPIPKSRRLLSPSPRPASLAGEAVGLVDGMVNPKAGWGRGILQAVEEELKSRWPRVDTERIARAQMGLHEPFRWAAAMAAKHAALVIAVGD